MTDIDLSAPEVQDAIKAAIADAVAGLKDKNAELLGEVRKLKQGRQIDPADVEKMEAEIDALKAKASDAEKAAKKAAQDADKAIKAQADAEGEVSKLLVDNGLTDALTKANVTNPALIKAAKAMLAGQVQIADEGGSKVAKFGDKALAEAITEWAGSDEGKHFVAAADTSGGGSQGGRGTTQTTTQGNAAGTRPEAVARAEQLLKQFEE